jgi:hypothetical protein
MPKRKWSSLSPCTLRPLVGRSREGRLLSIALALGFAVLALNSCAAVPQQSRTESSTRHPKMSFPDFTLRDDQKAALPLEVNPEALERFMSKVDPAQRDSFLAFFLGKFEQSMPSIVNIVPQDEEAAHLFAAIWPNGRPAQQPSDPTWYLPFIIALVDSEPENPARIVRRGELAIPDFVIVRRETSVAALAAAIELLQDDRRAHLPSTAIHRDLVVSDSAVSYYSSYLPQTVPQIRDYFVRLSSIMDSLSTAPVVGIPDIGMAHTLRYDPRAGKPNNP